MDRGVLVLIVGVILACILSFYLGLLRERQNNLNVIISTSHEGTEDIINRAKSINKPCYTNDDLEFIIFGESQL